MTEATQRVLVVEDEADLVTLLAEYPCSVRRVFDDPGVGDEKDRAPHPQVGAFFA